VTGRNQRRLALFLLFCALAIAVVDFGLFALGMQPAWWPSHLDLISAPLAVAGLFVHPTMFRKRAQAIARGRALRSY